MFFFFSQGFQAGSAGSTLSLNQVKTEGRRRGEEKHQNIGKEREKDNRVHTENPTRKERKQDNVVWKENLKFQRIGD